MKLALLFSLLSWQGLSLAQAPVSSDRFIMKILDRTVSLQDIQFQLRNIKGLNCVDPEALVIQYFGKDFIKELDGFLNKMPSEDEAARNYLHDHNETLKKTRYFFKILRYSEDQKAQVTPQLSGIIREGTAENKCDTAVLYKDSLKTNFISLLQMEMYFRSRYGGQLKSASSSFSVVRPSIDLFVESLDKQFSHEYYW